MIPVALWLFPPRTMATTRTFPEKWVIAAWINDDHADDADDDDHSDGDDDYDD